MLSGWLYRAAKFAAADALKKQRRSRLRDHEALEMETVPENQAVWEDIAPLLDDAMARLDDGDRNAILLRFFQNKSLNEVGVALHLSEDAARKRIARALERLRSFCIKLGNPTT